MRTRNKILCLLLPTILVLVLMTEWRSREQIGLAHQAVEELKTDLALKHYARAMNWYLPFGTAETAAEELYKLGTTWAKQGRNREAALALSRLRSGLYGARSFYTPRKDLIAKAEPLLARLRAQSKPDAGSSSESLEKRTTRYLSYLQKPIRPSTPAGLAASFGFLLWVAGVIALIFRFFGQAKTRSDPGIYICGGATLIGLVLWMLGMMAA